jgi:LCP family protein required for cell wall assembly
MPAPTSSSQGPPSSKKPISNTLQAGWPLWQRESNIMRNEKRKKSKALRAFLIFLLVLVVLAGAAGATAWVVYGKVIDKFEKVELVDYSGQDLGINPGVEESLQGYRNILMVGVDTRRGESEAWTRADAIIIISINEEAGTFRLISVYRDTLLELQKEDGELYLDKVTHSYYYGGPLGTIRALNHNMDLNIKEFVKVNWYTVADFVDAMGGLTLDVKDYEVAELNKYIKDTNKTLQGDTTAIAAPGKQVLNGVQAVTYCRIRKVGNGDYERTERMRNTIKAAFAKAKTMKIKELENVADLTLPEVTTNIDAKTMFWTLYDASKLSMKKGVGWPYETTGATVGGVWYGPPVSLNANVTKLHEEMFGQAGYVPSAEVQSIHDKIVRMTGVE